MLLLGAFSLALILTQSGCPQGAELESRDKWSERIASGGSSTTGPVLDFSTIQCTGTTPQAFLTSRCARNFCHGKTFSANLNLVPDDGFATRTLDVLATHGSILCEGDVLHDCVPEACPPMGTVKLIDSTDPTASWILTKVHGGQAGCGGPMPDANGLNADKDACITEIVNAVAALK